MYVGVLPRCIFERYVCSASRGQRKALNPLELSYRRLGAAMRVLGIKPQSSERAASVLNNWVGSLDPINMWSRIGHEPGPGDGTWRRDLARRTGSLIKFSLEPFAALYHAICYSLMFPNHKLISTLPSPTATTSHWAELPSLLTPLDCVKFRPRKPSCYMVQKVARYSSPCSCLHTLSTRERLCKLIKASVM